MKNGSAQTFKIYDSVSEKARRAAYCSRKARGDIPTFFSKKRLKYASFSNPRISAAREIGIYTPFRDGYANASISMTQRCHTHIWCGRNTSYVRAAKMGPARFGLGLVLTEGSLDTYSVDRELTLNEFGHYMSEDRGDFILHPSPFHLKPNECMRISWEMFWYEDGRFDEKLKEYDDIIRIRAERFTVFTNENITFSVCAREAEVFLDGNTIPTKCEGDETTVCFAPKRTGDHLFVVRVGKKETIARFFVQIPIRELIEK